MKFFESGVNSYISISLPSKYLQANFEVRGVSLGMRLILTVLLKAESKLSDGIIIFVDSLKPSLPFSGSHLTLIKQTFTRFYAIF